MKADYHIQGRLQVNSMRRGMNQNKVIVVVIVIATVIVYHFYYSKLQCSKQTI